MTLHIPLLLIMVPMIASIAMPLVRKARAVYTITMFVQALLAVLSLMLAASLWGGESYVYRMGHFPAPFGNELRAGVLEAIMSFVFSVVMFFALLGGERDARADIEDEKRYLYYLMVNLLTTSLMALVYTNDLFTAYVFVEINAVAACGIVVAKEKGETVKATLKYLIMSVLGSGAFLLSVSILYGITGQLLMEPAHEAIVKVVQSGQYTLPLTVTLVLFAVSISVKSALFPFHSWLPDAHGSATTSSSSILSGLVLKGYIFLFIKLLFRVYGIDVISQLGVMPALFAFGLMGMIVGSIMAFMQKDIKRMIAYSSVAQIGYIFMGIGMNTVAGYTAACFHIIAHAITKSMLFTAAGSLINTAGSQQIADLTGIGRRNKIVGIAFGVGALSMMGVPLFAGFASKWVLAGSVMDGSYGTWIALGFLALSTYLNALYYAPALLRLYGEPKKMAGMEEPVLSDKKQPGSVNLTLGILVVANIALGIFYTPVMQAIMTGFSNLTG